MVTGLEKHIVGMVRILAVGGCTSMGLNQFVPTMSTMKLLCIGMFVCTFEERGWTLLPYVMNTWKAWVDNAIFYVKSTAFLLLYVLKKRDIRVAYTWVMQLDQDAMQGEPMCVLLRAVLHMLVKSCWRNPSFWSGTSGAFEITKRTRWNDGTEERAGWSWR